MFFKAMPYISYKTKDKTIATKDIFTRVGLDRKINTTLALEAYYISEGETPDIVANNIYGSSNYHWILLIVNDIVNPADEWPKRTAELFDYTESKYGTGNALLDHHYRLTSDTSIIVDYDSAKILSGEMESVSNYDYELEINQDKRQIFILKPEYLSKFVSNYKELMAK
jgi:hypothetical protein